MRKIFRYELRRAVCNKFFLGLLVVSLYFGWQTLNSEVIKGIAHTAPFSPWSFGYYSAQVLPLLSVALLFFLWGIFSKEARRVKPLTDATPVNAGNYLMGKCAAVGSAWLLLAVCVCALGMGFLSTLFGAVVSIGELLIPVLVSLLPAFVFVLGLGMAAGHIHPALILVLMPVMLSINLLPLPAEWGLFGATWLSEYPLTLETLDPAFALPASVWGIKTIFLLVGMGLIALTIRLETKSS